MNDETILTILYDNCRFRKELGSYKYYGMLQCLSKNHTIPRHEQLNHLKLIGKFVKLDIHTAAKLSIIFDKNISKKDYKINNTGEEFFSEYDITKWMEIQDSLKQSGQRKYLLEKAIQCYHNNSFSLSDTFTPTSKQIGPYSIHEESQLAYKYINGSLQIPIEEVTYKLFRNIFLNKKTNYKSIMKYVKKMSLRILFDPEFRPDDVKKHFVLHYMSKNGINIPTQFDYCDLSKFEYNSLKIDADVIFKEMILYKNRL